MKGQMLEKDKTLAKQRNVYKEIRTVRDKLRDSERARLSQDHAIRELKDTLAQATRENVSLRKKL